MIPIKRLLALLNLPSPVKMEFGVTLVLIGTLNNDGSEK